MSDKVPQGPVYAVAGCHFVASFAALGLPPYLVEILPTLGDENARWAGVLYVVPTICGALAAPFWGALADRFGRKRLLLRAQLGLAVTFLLAGLAQSLGAFVGALILQGLLGGTFAASTGYLAGTVPPTRLAWALTLMQGSARAALVAAPIAVGALSPVLAPQRQYAVMALLPLTAAVVLALLPEPKPAGAAGAAGRGDASGAATEGKHGGQAESAGHAPQPTPRHALRALLALEFAFVFATIVTFPYLTALVEQRHPELPSAAAGFVFALPHVCYLLLARPALAAVGPRPVHGIAAAFALVAAGCALHLPDAGVGVLLVARLVFGVGLTAGLVALAALTAECARGRAPGSLFGTLELVSKMGAVAAGLAASALASRMGLGAPPVTGAVFAATTALLVVVLTRFRPDPRADAPRPSSDRPPLRRSAKELHAQRRDRRRPVEPSGPCAGQPATGSPDSRRSDHAHAVELPSP